MARRCCHDASEPWNEDMPRALMVRPHRVMPLMKAASNALQAAVTIPSCLPGLQSAISCRALVALPVPFSSAYIMASVLSRQYVSTALAKVSSSTGWSVSFMTTSFAWRFPASFPWARGRICRSDRRVSRRGAWPGPPRVG